MEIFPGVAQAGHAGAELPVKRGPLISVSFLRAWRR